MNSSNSNNNHSIILPTNITSGSSITLSSSSDGNLMIDGELYINEHHIYELVVDILELSQNPQKIALWLTSDNDIERRVAERLVKIKNKEDK